MKTKIFSDNYLRILLRASLLVIAMGAVTIGTSNSSAFVSDDNFVLSEFDSKAVSIKCSTTKEYSIPVCCLSSTETGEQYGCALRP